MTTFKTLLLAAALAAPAAIVSTSATAQVGGVAVAGLAVVFGDAYLGLSLPLLDTALAGTAMRFA